MANKKVIRRRSAEFITLPEFDKTSGEIKDVKFWTVDALAKKYNCSDVAVRRRMDHFKISNKVINGTIFLKDDARLEQRIDNSKRGFASEGNGKNAMKQMSYNNLVSEVQKLSKQVEEISNGGIQIDAGEFVKMFEKFLENQFVEIYHFMTLTLQERKEALASYTHRIEVKELTSVK